MFAVHHLNIEVTKQCNQRCVYCFNDSGPWVRSSSLTSDQWLRILGVLQTVGLRSVHLTGGEPFFWPGILDLLRSIQQLGLDTSILSNGYRIPQLAASYPAVFSNLRVAQISLDAVDPAIHDRRRGTANAWQQAVAAIECLRKLAVPVEISSVISASNLGQLPQLAEYCQDQGCTLLPRLLVNLGRGREHEPSSSVANQFRSMVQHVQHDHPGLCVADRFLYVPSVSTLDCQGHLRGYHTVSPEGRLRSVSISVHGQLIDDLTCLLKAA